MRCSYTHSKLGQCPLEAMEELEYCSAHYKNDPEGLQKAQYNLAQYYNRTRYNQFLENDELRSLRDEVALARMALERRLNLITNDAEFIAASGSLQTMFMTIEKLVNTCHRLETSLGLLLSKPTLLRIVQQIVDILIDELAPISNHEELIDKITERIVQTIAEVKGE